MSATGPQYNWSPLACTSTPIVLPKAEQERILAERPPEIQRLIANVEKAQKPIWSPAALRRLAKVLDISQEWRKKARCQGLEGDRFFPGQYENAVAKQAKQICQECTVRKDCLEYALKVGEKHGIWGGLSERERRPLHKAMEQRKSA